MPRDFEKEKFAQLSIYVKPEIMKEVDRLAKIAGLSRSQFIETVLEITIENETPLINFSLRLGRVARKLWPKWGKQVEREAKLSV